MKKLLILPAVALVFCITACHHNNNHNNNNGWHGTNPNALHNRNKQAFKKDGKVDDKSDKKGKKNYKKNY